MSEHTVGQSESDTSLLRDKLNGLLAEIFPDMDIQTIRVFPAEASEWEIHMPTFLALTGSKGRKLHHIALQPSTTGLIPTVALINFQDESPLDSITFSRWESKDFVYEGPVTTGQMYQVKRLLKKDINQDLQSLKAFEEVLEYVLLVRAMDQLPNQQTDEA